MLYIWFMRKVIADMQNRIGPNRAGPFGVLQTLADGIKLFFKEQSIPDTADRPRVPARAVPVDHARVPDVLRRARSAARSRSSGTRRTCRSPTCPIGVLFILAMSGLGVYGVMLAGWSSGSKYPLLGSVRASAQLVSLRGRVRARDRRRADPGGHALDARRSSTQQAWIELDSFVNATGTGCRRSCRSSIFLIAATAETNHPPFDLVEAEQELVGGFHTEYTGIRFAIFFLAEFMNVITMSAIVGHAVPRRPVGPGARVPRRRRLRQRVDHAGLLVLRRRCSCCCSRRCGCARRCRACATTS